MQKPLEEIHPGEVLLNDFMIPMNITANKLAADLNVAADEIGGVLQGECSVTPEMATRLGRYFKMDPWFWINLQAEFDMRTTGPG